MQRPIGILLADELEKNLSVVGRDSAEKIRLSSVDDDHHHLDNTARIFDGDGPADPPGWVKDQSSWMVPKVNIPDEVCRWTVLFLSAWFPLLCLCFLHRVLLTQLCFSSGARRR